MHQHSVFKLRHLAFLVIIAFMLLLSGCVHSNEPIDESTSGWFNHYFIYYFSRSIQFFGEMFGGNYGLSIITMTLLIRLILMPLMMLQFRGQRTMQEMMKRIQPEMTAIQDKYKNQKNEESQRNKQQEIMQLYQQHQINPLAIGCLPMLLQLPFLLGFYYAIARTSEIAHHEFLWFNLGQTDLIMPLIAAGVYVLHTKVSQAISPLPQNKHMAILPYLSPIMIGIFSFNVPAAMPLYWVVGGLFLIGQSWLFNRLFKIPAEAG